MPRRKKAEASGIEVQESHAEKNADGTVTPGKNPRGFVLDASNYIEPSADKDYKFGGSHQSYVARNKSAGWEVAKDPAGKPVVVGNMTLLQRSRERGDEERRFKTEEKEKQIRRVSADRQRQKLGGDVFGTERREGTRWI